MSKLITKENDTYKELEACLQEQRRKLKSFYWTQHENIGSHGYEGGGSQNSDTIALGKIAEAQLAVENALSSLHEIPRR